MRRHDTGDPRRVYKESLLNIFMLLPNYLENLDENINIFDISDLLKDLHKTHGQEIRKDFIGKIHQSLYYYWINNQSPIKIKHLKIFAKYDKLLFNKVFSKAKYFSAGQKKVKLPKILTQDLAYLIGAFHGDGHISKNFRNMDLSEEYLSYHYVIRNLCKKIFNDEVHITKTRIRGTIIYKSLISSKVITSFFKLFCPIGKKKGSLRVPSLFKKNRKILRAYLTGFFDTDGGLPHIEKERKDLYFLFLQSDKRIVFEVWECLNNLGIPTNEPKPFKSPKDLYSKIRDRIEWRIYIGSKKTLRTLLKLIKFKHPIKKMRSKMILDVINGPVV